MSKKHRPRIDERWIRHDWRMWLRPDFERWIKPGVDPADVIPALARERAEREDAEERARAAEDAELAALIDHERRALAALNEEMKEVNAEMARRRRILAEDEAKYSPSQPRVPAGNPRGGRWTNRSEGGSAVGGFDSATPAGADATGDAEEAGGNAYDATPSTDEAGSAPWEGDGTRGYDDRLASSDKPSPGRAAMLGIMARAAARLVEAYRSENLLHDLFGEKGGAVAVTTMDDKDIFGSNSKSATYTDADFRAARSMRDTLATKYPGVISTENAGYTSGNALFHAETNVLLRAAETNGGTLAGKSLDIYVDRNICKNCESIIPLVGLELGNPTLTYVDPRRIYSIANGTISFRSRP